MCHNMFECNIELIGEEFKGPVLHQTGRVHKEDWLTMFQKYPNKLFHAVKWWLCKFFLFVWNFLVK